MFTDPQFVDANGVGGLNAAVGTVSGAFASLGLATFATPGLIEPEAMVYSAAAMIATTSFPSPFGIMTSGGLVVRAHGTLTNADTQSYATNFASLVPGGGSVTAYLAATIVQIQQNPFLLTGPPPGHPNYNPNFTPTIAYANQVYSLSLAAVTGGIDNISTFEIFRTTLTAGQTSLGAISTGFQRRTAAANAKPVLSVTGGALSVSGLYSFMTPSASGLTSTLPPVSGAAGLVASFTNQQPGNFTIATSSGDQIYGYLQSSSGVNSITLPSQATIELYSAGQQWNIKGITPAIMTQLNNTWTGTNTFIDPGNTLGIVVSGSTSAGANIKLTGNGTTTPSKWIRAINGEFSIINNAYSAEIMHLDDSGDVVFLGSGTFGSLYTTGNITGGSLNVNGIADISGQLNVANIESTNNIQSINGILIGLSVQSTAGDVTAGGGRLRAEFGALGSGDPNAAPILNDFPFNASYFQLPNGLIVQYGAIVVPGGTIETVFNFAVSFPNGVYFVGISYQAATPPPNGSVGAQASNNSQFIATNSYSTGSNGCYWWAIGF